MTLRTLAVHVDHHRRVAWQSVGVQTGHRHHIVHDPVVDEQLRGLCRTRERDATLDGATESAQRRYGREGVAQTEGTEHEDVDAHGQEGSVEAATTSSRISCPGGSASTNMIARATSD